MSKQIALGETTRSYHTWPSKPLLTIRSTNPGHARPLLWLVRPTGDYVLAREEAGIVLGKHARQFDYLLPVEKNVGLKDPPEPDDRVDFYLEGDIIAVRAATAQVEFINPRGGPDTTKGATGFISFYNFVWLHPIFEDPTVLGRGQKHSQLFKNTRF